jgi:GDPmannose 4,6-dehydratase
VCILLPVRKRALIFGITGQDGSYLSEFLLGKGYEVHGVIRRASNFNTERIDHLLNQATEGSIPFALHYGDLLDGSSIHSVIARTRPDEIYNLAAQSHVKVSFEIPEFTTDVVATGTLRILEAIRAQNCGIRYYQAGSSEMYGRVAQTPQNEQTPFVPRSPYAAAKVYAHEMTRLYRDAYLLHASNGILFNHESPRRGNTFVTHKVTRGVAEIVLGRSSQLVLGNLDAKRDWGYAPEYVEAMWLMLQQERPGDYVIATGETHTVRELCEVAFSLVGLDWKKYVISDERYYRPAEVDLLLGDPTRAKNVLGWEPKVKFHELVNIMLQADLEKLRGNSGGAR